MRDAPRFNDRIIKDGFPDRFYVQDRICQNAAILCCEGGMFGSNALCVRPRAMTTDDWLPDARRIAHGYVLMAGDLPPTAPQIAADPRVQALVEALEDIGHMGFDMPATLELTDDQWRRRRTATMQMVARTALAAFKETGE